MAGRQVDRFAAVAAGVLAVAVLGACGSQEGADDRSPGAEPGRTLTVELPDAAPGRCMVPSADFLGESEIAFEGTVTSVDDEEATLEVTRWFRGDDDVTTVTVTAPDMSRTSVAGVEFHEGKTYLVSANDGRATLCGYTAVSSPALAEMYAEAFGTP